MQPVKGCSTRRSDDIGEDIDCSSASGLQQLLQTRFKLAIRMSTILAASISDIYLLHVGLF